MIDIVANESGWFTLKGITLSTEQIFYVVSIIVAYYIAKRKQWIEKYMLGKIRSYIDDKEE